MNPPLTLASAARWIAAGDLSPVDLVEHCLARIEQFEPTIGAWVLVDAEGARRQAQRAADELAHGHSRGPLHGIPLGVKDIIDVEGWPTRAGSPLLSDQAAGRDARIISRLRAAGAIFLGKTVTTEFASFDPPPTVNPWNAERTPGGSSSGSAAAVALGMCLGALGSQTGGSITRPACYCGVSGCKPTYGLVSLEGIFPLAFHLDHPGPIARRVADLAILLEILAEPRGVSVAAPREAPPYASLLEAGYRPRLGIIEEFFVTEAEPAIQKLFGAAIEALRSAGAKVSSLRLPESFREVGKLHRRIMAVEAAEVHRDRYPAQKSQFGPALAALLDEGRATPLVDYVAALRHQQALRAEMRDCFEAIDAIAVPATTSTAPDRSTTGNPAFNSPWSYAGLPVVSIPTGLAEDGLPGGIQFIGPPLGEAGVLATAHWCEQIVAFDALPPLMARS
jgi:aspartyl-tRNA(Asn)/glutamyl-tRNA(Gln) amidotransferase subunit A